MEVRVRLHIISSCEKEYVLSLVTFQIYLYVIILEHVFFSCHGCISFLYFIFHNFGNELSQHDMKTKLFLVVKLG
jgi:hypothetical protein